MHLLLGAHHPAAVHLGDGLMAQAHPEGGHRCGKFFEDVEADARLIRVARAWREQDRVGLQRADLLQADGVVAMHLQVGCQRMLGGELTEVLHQVEGEAVVVVDDQQHLRIGSQSPRRSKSGGSRRNRAISKELMAAVSTAAAAQSLAMRAKG